MKNNIFLFLILFSYGVFGSDVFKDNFESTKRQWSFFGSGLHSYYLDGRSEGRSLVLSNDWGDQVSAYLYLPKVKNKYLLVSYKVFTNNLHPSVQGQSFSNFYKTNETKYIFTSIDNSSKWRQVKYTIRSGNEGLLFWLRLKGSGKVYIDDFSVKVISKKQPFTVSNIRSMKAPNLRPSRSSAQRKIADKVLLDFDNHFAVEHTLKLNNKSNKSAVMRSGKYYHLNAVDFSINGLVNYNQLRFRMYNPSSKFAELFFVLSDDDSSNYWDQNNYKTHLAPGWNTLHFDLDRFVGERGSVRYRRKLDLSSLAKAYLVIDLDKSEKAKGKFLFDDLTLISNPYPVKDSNIIHLDFSSIKSRTQIGVQRITTQDILSDSVKSGFTANTKFGKVSNDLYAGDNLSTSIGVLRGEYSLKVPNGVYYFKLVSERLGYWDAPFWSHREIRVNSKVLELRERPLFSDFLDDLFIFKDLPMNTSSSPYVEINKRVFTPYTGKIKVTNGRVNFSFKGDESSINLNELILYPVGLKSKAQKYLFSLKKFRENKLKLLSRFIGKTKRNFLAKKNIVSTTDLSMKLTPYMKLDVKSDKSISLNGADGEWGSKVIAISPKKSGSVISVEASVLVDDKGNTLFESEFVIKYIKYLHSSPDINHETYFLAASLVDKYSKMKHENDFNQYFFVQLKPSSKTKPGIYRGNIKVKVDGHAEKIPVSFNVLPYSLPRISFPVGFFGLSPIGHTYFEGTGKDEMMKVFYNSSLKALSERGFTTFTSLPRAKKIDDGLYDTTTQDYIFKKMKEYNFSNTIYSYGGEFLSNILADLSNKVDIESFGLNYKGNHWPTIVYTFSDEASGYSSRVAEDIKVASDLKRKFPFLKLGGFSSMKSKSTKALNKTFDYAFYTSINKKELSNLTKSGQRWGMYNGSSAPLVSPVKSFSLGLFYGELSGQSQYLDWHLSSLQNYPYNIFDGRENDIVMLYPNRDGSVSPSVKFEMASMGLTIYRKLILLGNLIKKDEGPSASLLKAKKWYRKLIKANPFLSDPYLSRMTDKQIKEIELTLNIHLSRLTRP